MKVVKGGSEKRTGKVKVGDTPLRQQPAQHRMNL
jgi:hypothetical protein